MARKRKSSPPSRRSPIRWTAQEDGILIKTVHACTIRGEDQSLPSDNKRARKDTIAWKLVAQSLPGRTNRDCRKRWFKIDRRWSQGPWAPDEETQLREAVDIDLLFVKWDEVSFSVKTRNPDRACLLKRDTQKCLEHWEKTLYPFAANQSREPTDDMKLPEVVAHSGHLSSYTQEGLAGRPILEFKDW
ncbi:hypothetical protein AO1008_07708 [Aspergillus oryzae 100-8]|uniref:Myb-like domain-containing protein n=1 Tax=Aspergillus oryzae (strain 3.042) TaxID=1160506 RepID=I8TMC4_ASPO3|nr:hypothetical protein Ao3042_08831 [Aspergillus oryzae 3.042]KDE81386.1 hypothetical protein AO1008_07708 [Aspergillus oryzae 100-8]|eukprot:EIT75033.1 hypothetical protein Ao3042_08831 [Aspergillus oryzae 3.042]